MNDTKDFIGVYKNAISKELCDKAVRYFKEMEVLTNARTRQQFENSSKVDKDDTVVFMTDLDCQSTTAREVLIGFNDVFWGACYNHYASTFDVLKACTAAHNSYNVKVQRTNVGQGYHVWHYESGSRDVSNRILTWTLYLNDVEEGGETEFLYYPRRIKPETGMVVIFPAGFTHTHRGNPPLSNSKYLMTGWVEF
jgi:hypothetical protein